MPIETQDNDCPDCAGTGFDQAMFDDPCQTCAGEGTDPDLEGAA